MAVTVNSPDPPASEVASDVAFLAEVRSQHERLDLLLCAVQEVLSARSEIRESKMLDTALVVLLTYLNKELPLHFEFEERGGFFSDVIRVAPHMSGEIDRLTRDHCEFIECSRVALDLSNHALLDSRRWEEVEKEFRKLCARLIVHERDECCMIKEAALSEDTTSPCEES